MKRFLFFILIIGLCTSADQKFFEIKELTDQKLTLTFSIGEYEFENKEGYVNINLHGAGTQSLIGEPLLPSVSSFIELDKHSSYTIDYQVISKKEYLNKETDLYSSLLDVSCFIASLTDGLALEWYKKLS